MTHSPVPVISPYFNFLLEKFSGQVLRLRAISKFV